MHIVEGSPKRHTFSQKKKNGAILERPLAFSNCPTAPAILPECFKAVSLKPVPSECFGLRLSSSPAHITSDQGVQQVHLEGNKLSTHVLELEISLYSQDAVFCPHCQLLHSAITEIAVYAWPCVRGSVNNMLFGNWENSVSV